MTTRIPPLRVGYVANQDPGGSIHLEAFTRARSLHAELERPSFELLEDNDHATAVGAERAANRLVARGAELVIGHFASDAASGAIPVYRRHRVPLLLPAASDDRLTKAAGGVFRLCDSDGRLAEMLCADLAARHPRASFGVAHDDTRRGAGLGELIRTCLARRGLLLHPHQFADIAVFAGGFAESVRFAKQARSGRPRRLIVLTDDAVHPALACGLRDQADSVVAYGFAPRGEGASERERAAYRARWASEPNSYFIETYAALQIAQLVRERPGPCLMTRLASQTWTTALGRLRFVSGEGGAGQIARFTIAGDQLVASPLDLRSEPRTS